MADYIQRTKAYWTTQREEYATAGERAWASKEITWGIFERPEREVCALTGIRLENSDCIELGCGAAYISAWLARRGACPVGVDLTPSQLETARHLQRKHGLSFPLIEGNAEELEICDESFDLAISEYGASIWCDPLKWIPEAVRLLKPGGHLVFLRNSALAMCCAPDVGPISKNLVRPCFGLHRVDFPDATEFSLPSGDMVRLLRGLGMEIEDLIELQAPPDFKTRYDFFEPEWPVQWPLEEIWRARKT